MADLLQSFQKLMNRVNTDENRSCVQSAERFWLSARKKAEGVALATLRFSDDVESQKIQRDDAWKIGISII
jgi:hypothetical protein